MAHMNEIKHRIKSIKDTRQITKAMQLISASKLRKARKQLDETLPYFDKVRLTMADILAHSHNMDNRFFDLRHEKMGRKRAYVILTGDKGLAGSYNHNVIRIAEKHLEKHPGSLLMVAGHVGQHYFMKKRANIDLNFDYPTLNPNIFRAREMSEYILKAFEREKVDEVYMIYTFLKTTLNLEVLVNKILPLDLDELKEELNIETSIHSENIVYEPSPSAVLHLLVQKYMKGIIYGALVEAFTSEQSSRMTSMDSATKNADEILRHLKLYYNRARQAAITQEIMEIVDG